MRDGNVGPKISDDDTSSMKKMTYSWRYEEQEQAQISHTPMVLATVVLIIIFLAVLVSYKRRIRDLNQR